jgi:hypothetical protein
MATKEKTTKNSDKKAVEKVLTSRKEQKNRYKAEDFKQYYCNNSSMMFTVWDAVITFGQVVRNEKGETEGTEEKLDVVMSHAHFKAFVSILSQNLAAIEKRYGEIQILEFKASDELETAE